MTGVNRLYRAMQQRKTSAAAAPARRIRTAVPDSDEPVTPRVVKLSKTITPGTDVLKAARASGRAARRGEYLHVSDLLYKCARKFALIERHEDQRPPQSLSLNDACTYAQGEAIHDVLRERMRMGAPDKVWGKWTCKCGQTLHKTPSLFIEVRGDTCKVCKGPVDVYTEVSFFNEEYKIVGNPDLILYLREEDAFIPVELKSISHEQFKELVRPIPDHVLQVLFYWKLMKEAGLKVGDRISIIYQTKGYVFVGASYKEFVINAAEEERRLVPYIEEAVALRTAREGGELPKRICVSADASEAKKCHMCQICFGDNSAAPKKIDLVKRLSGPSPRR